MDDTYQRWEDKTHEAVSAMSTTILTLSLGSLAFIMASMEKLAPLEIVHSRTTINAILGLFGGSVLLSLMVMSSRLVDFRSTTDLKRLETQSPHLIHEAKALRKRASWAEKRTWVYLIGQVLLFGIGIVILTGQVIYLYPALSRHY